MFLRTVNAAGGKGTQHEYVRLVEAFREDGKTKQRVVCNLGRKDLLEVHLDALVRVRNGWWPPRSEPGWARGLERDLVGDGRGGRLEPLWREDAERRASRLP